ncbi:unnamed protein product [Discosporangium mesarthrocarpum]
MVAMFGPAEVWDIALMQLDLGRALLQKGGSEDKAATVLTLGLEWLRTCLGEDCGLQEEQEARLCLEKIQGGHDETRVGGHTE